MKKIIFTAILAVILTVVYSLTFTSCNKDSEVFNVSDATQSAYLCDSYIPNEDRFKSNVDIYSNIHPIVYTYKDTPLPEIDFKRIEKKINKKFGKCNMYFTLSTPQYIEVRDSVISYRTDLNTEFRLGELRMSIYPKGIKFYEEGLGIIQGAANGIPSVENPSLGKPIFFIRSEKMYTDIVSHELGHVYGLYHTFQGNDHDLKGLNCDTGDKIIDTVTPPEDLAIVISTCEPMSEAIEKYSKEEIQNFIQNPLSYSPDQCMGDFEKTQCDRMRKIVEVNLALQAPVYKIEVHDN